MWFHHVNQDARARRNIRDELSKGG
jgi:hypothetical protein